MEINELKEFIELEHWSNKKSLNELAPTLGITRQGLAYKLRSLGIKYRTISEATKLTKNKGDKHWGFGKTKETCKHMRASSLRMKKNNPSLCEEIKERAAIKRAEYFRANLLPQEILFKSILDKFGVKYLVQHPIKSFIMDFFIPKKNLCIEIDSLKKWGADRCLKASLRDAKLLNLGIRTLRICKSKLSDIEYINNILKTQNIIR